MNERALREQVAALLRWQDAHAGMDHVVDRVPPDQWTATAPGLPYTLWQLLEHLRLTQYDILDFCRNPSYVERRWPEDYWPKKYDRPSAKADAASLRS